MVNGNSALQIVDNYEMYAQYFYFRIISEARGVEILPNLNGSLALKVLRFDRASIQTIPPDICEHCPELRSL